MLTKFAKFAGNAIVLWTVFLASGTTLAATNADGEHTAGRDDRLDSSQRSRSDTPGVQQNGALLQPLPVLPSQPKTSVEPAALVESAQPMEAMPNQTPPPDTGRRQGKMSPEERRALRQQINQASHELYPMPR